MATIITPQIEQDICDSYAGGASFSLLEAKYKLFYTDVNDILTKYNIPHREMGEFKRILKGREQEVIDKYKDGLSVRKLAVEYGVDRSVINRILKQYSVPRRSISDSNVKKEYDVDKMVSMYKSGVGFSEIAKQTGVTSGCVHTKLVKLGVHHKSPSNKGPKSRIPNEVVAKAVHLYQNEGWSLMDIIEELSIGTGHGGLSKRFRELGISIRPGSIQNKKYSCDSSYFADPHTPSKYWVLGFIATDGYVQESKKFLSIELSDVDVEALEFIKKELAFTGPISRNSKKKTATICIHDDQLIDDLVRLGIRQKKSLTISKLPWVKDELFHHFLNGVVMGDGSISLCSIKGRKQQRLCVSFCGSSTFIQWIADKTSALVGIALCHVIRYGNHSYTATSNPKAIKLCEYMFTDAPFYLKRKHDKYQQMTAYINSKP